MSVMSDRDTASRDDDAAPEGQPRSSALATWALYAGLVGLLSALATIGSVTFGGLAPDLFGLLCLLGLAIGLVFGVIALARRHPGRGNAIAAVVLVAAGLLWVALPFFPRARADCCCSDCCVSSLKQIQLGLTMYASDNNQRYPPAAADDGTGLYWPSLILPYIKDVQIFLCPSDTIITGCIVLPPPNRVTNMSYGRNSFMGTPGFSDAMCTYPAEMLGVIDAVSPTINYDAPFSLVHKEIGSLSPPVTIRHDSGCNQSYMDGHVGWIAFTNIPDTFSGSPPAKSAAKHYWQGTD
jgi:prepilin-type processing-associated H-X9-DG protein